MKTLWTPWRMEHVTGTAPRQDGCLFEPPGGETSNREYLLLYRDDTCLVLLNRYPYANGHLLVAPIRHTEDFTGLRHKESAALMRMLQNCCRILKCHLTPDGFNIGLNIGSVAGAGIDDHLHFHIIPRWEGDHNFMTVTAEIRAIPQHIDRTFDLLLPDFLDLRVSGGRHE